MELKDHAIEFAEMTRQMPALGGGWFSKDQIGLNSIAYPIDEPIRISYQKGDEKVEGQVYEYRYNELTKKMYVGFAIRSGSQVVSGSCITTSIKPSDGSVLQVPVVNFTGQPAPKVYPTVPYQEQKPPQKKSFDKPTKHVEPKIPVPKLTDLAQHPDYLLVEVFVGLITTDEGKTKHKAFFNKYKAMTQGFARWQLITEKKFNNLNLLRLEFDKATA